MQRWGDPECTCITVSASPAACHSEARPLGPVCGCMERKGTKGNKDDRGGFIQTGGAKLGGRVSLYPHSPNSRPRQPPGVFWRIYFFPHSVLPPGEGGEVPGDSIGGEMARDLFY